MPKELKIESCFRVYETESDLSNEEQKLLTEAKIAMKGAYAPYSNFHVGAAVLLDNGVIVTGNNQENAAYPSGLCAERVAVFHASSQFPGVKIITIAISAYSEKKIINKPVSPCGACRQSISEYEIRSGTPIKIIMSGESGEVFTSDSISNLLPLTFSSSDLLK